MKLSSLALAVTLALASSASFAAGGPLDLSSGSAGLQGTPAAGSFADVYTFSLVSTVVASASITSVVNGAQDIDFSSIVISGPSGSFSFSLLLGDPVEVWSLSSTTLAPGSYTLTLSGTNSPAGASYGGNLAVSAVPEPETYAMLLAGLGGLGFVVRRRRLD